MTKLYKILLAALLGIQSLTSTALFVQAKTEDEITPENYEESLQDIDVEKPAPRGALPSPAQLKYYEDETSAFIHFGINTFTGDEWSDGTRDPKLYAPTEIDTDQWVTALKNAGFKKIILTAKHHDGFLLWPSQYSDYSVANSGDASKTDVLAELSRSCTEQNMNMGLYLSPWDRHEPSYGVPVDEFLNPTDEPDLNGDYNQYYLNQLKEILEDPKYGNNGHFSELWMDGAKRGNAIQPYALTQWWEYTRQQEVGPDGIHGTADDVLLFNNIGEDVRWVGNESGYSYDPIWPQVSKTKLWNDYNYGIGGTPENPRPPVCNNGSCEPASYEDGTYLTKGQYDGDQWSMPESDFSIIGDWFYKTGKAPISGAEIAKHYFQTVGNATPMLLNVPPNKQGKLDESYIASLKEYREILDHTFQTNFMDGATATASTTWGNAKAYSANNVLDGDADTFWAAEEGETTGSITVYLDGEKQFDVVDIKEYIELGQNISKYDIQVRVNGEWQTFGIQNYTSSPDSARKTMSTIGARSLIRGNTVIADAIRLNITGSYGTPMIREMGAYKMDSRIEYSQGGTMVPASLKLKEAHSAQTSGSWNRNDSDTFRPNSISTWDANASATYTFTGSKFYLSSRHSWNFGAMEVSVDGQEPFLVDLYSKTLDTSVIVYESEDLTYGEHQVMIKPHTSPTSDKPDVVTIASDGLYYLDNEGRGMFELSAAEMTVNETATATLTVKRVGGASGPASVHIQTDPGTAVQGDAFTPINETLYFMDGEKEKNIEVETLASIRPGDLNFTVKLSSPESIGMGFVTRCLITILNKDIEVHRDALSEAITAAQKKQEENFHKKNWFGLQQAIQNAQKVMEDLNASQASVDQATSTLQDALRLYRAEGTYMNLYTNEATSFEMEQGDLTGIATVFKKGDYQQFADASGDGLVGNLYDNGAVSIYFDAPLPGTYELTVRTYAGAANNTVQWSNEKTGDLAITGSMPVQADVIGFGVCSTEIEIREAGMQYLKFMDWETPTTPNLDKIELRYKGQLILPESVKISEEQVSLTSGQKQQLQAIFAPSDAITEALWYSEDTNIASVDDTGVVTAHQAGTTTIHIVTSQNLYAQIDVTVEEAQTELGKEILGAAIRKANDLIASGKLAGLAEKVVAKFYLALEKAVEVYADPDATTKAYISAWMELADAMHYLDFKADKSDLQALIQECEEIDLSAYEDDESKEDFIQTLTNAKEIAENQNALDESIKKAYDALLDAKSRLHEKMKLDTTILVYLLDQAEAVMKQKDLYDTAAASWTIFEAAYANAQKVCNEAKRQEEIDAAAQALADAYSDIRLIANEDVLKQLQDFLNRINQMNLADYREADQQIILDARTYVTSLLEQESFTMEEYRTAEKHMWAVDGLTKIKHSDVNDPATDQKDKNKTPQTHEDAQYGAATGDVTSLWLMGGLWLLSAMFVCLFIKKRSASMRSSKK